MTRLKPTHAVLLIVLTLTLGFYLPALFNGFTKWDDPFLILENPAVRSLSAQNIASFFRQSTDVQPFIPLTMITFAVEYHFFGDNPFVYHLNNVLLHLGVVALIYVLALRMKLSVPAAGLAALFFGLHPVHVESVAWAAERKDVLCAVFYLGAVLFYLNYRRDRRLQDYIVSLLLAALSMLAKPMAVSLPLVLLVFDWWERGKIRPRDLTNKTAYLAILVPLAAVTYLTWARNPVSNIFQAPLIWIWGLTFYIKKFFLPLVLLPHYILPKPVSLAQPEYLSALLILVLLGWSAFRFRNNRMMILAFLLYLASIFFLLPLDDVERAGNFTIAADRFMYLPSLGFCLWLGHAAAAMLEKIRVAGDSRRLMTAFVLIGLLTGALGLKTSQQIRIWKDNLTLWDHTVRLSPDDFLALINRGYEKVSRRDVEGGITDYLTALTLRPENARAFCVLGKAYEALEKNDIALGCYNRAARFEPNEACAYVNRGSLLLRLNQPLPALTDLNRAAKLAPDEAGVENNLAVAYASLGQNQAALDHFNRAAELDPFFTDAFLNRGIFLCQEGKKDRARADFAKTLTLDPAHPHARRYLAACGASPESPSP